MKKLLFFLAVLIVLYFVGSNIKQASWFPFGNKGEQTESIENIDKIDLDIGSYDVKVIPDDREDIKAEITGKGKLNMNRSGDTIRIEVIRRWLDGINFWSKSRLNVYIPESYDQDIDLSIGSGRIVMSGKTENSPMKLKNLNVKMGSGIVKLENLDVQRFYHKGSSGKSNINAITAKTGTIKMESGIVDVNQYKGKLDAKLSSGKMDIQMAELNDSIMLKVNSGMANLDLPKDASFTLNGEVGSGIFSCDFPLNNRQDNEKVVKGTHGSGEYKIDAKVSSGKLKIY